MEQFLPSKQVKLFTEKVITPEFAARMAREPIRAGAPEELIRVANQVFSAVPKHPYVWQLFLKAVERSKRHKVQCDYDILYIGANAMMSTMYDQVGQYRDDIELVAEMTTKTMVTISSNGSWRTDK
jgi:hypothetical protein